MNAKILIADDEPNQLELLSFNLRQAGFTVFEAADGKQAVNMVEDLQPDLVILDWMMPHMSGIEVCRLFRSRTETKTCQLLF